MLAELRGEERRLRSPEQEEGRLAQSPKGGGGGGIISITWGGTRGDKWWSLSTKDFFPSKRNFFGHQQPVRWCKAKKVHFCGGWGNNTYSAEPKCVEGGEKEGYKKVKQSRNSLEWESKYWGGKGSLLFFNGRKEGSSSCLVSFFKPVC